MHRTIIVGSPRENGRSAHLAQQIFDACIDECPEDGISLISVASVNVAPCTGCNACEKAVSEDSTCYVAPPDTDDPLRQCKIIFKSDANAHQCVIDDGMKDVRLHMDASDELIVVSPVYFSGAPAQLKALLDRLQPYFFSNVWKRTKERRPAILHIVGEGGDPNGFDPVIGVVKSAFAIAGFRLECVYDWVGCIDEEGQITSDAREIEIA